MLGFNWVDLIIFTVLVLVMVEAVRIGVLSQVFFIAGFFASLFISGWLLPHVIRFDDLTLRTLVNGIVVLVVSTYVAMRCFDVGQNIHWSFRLGKLRKNHNLETAETVLGGLPGLAAGIVLVWLLAVTIGRLPFVGLSNSVNDARIVQALTHLLPPAPAVFAAFNSQIDPNAQPYVALQTKPRPTLNYDVSTFQAATSKATASVVRITSFSCGGIVTGSGFMAGPDLIATNAHIVAGARRPIVKYNDESYEATPVYFNAQLDLAILRVPKLSAPILALAPDNVRLDSTVAALGYPGGNYKATPGIIRDTRATTAANIYSLGSFDRGIYVVQAQLEAGNSGGPIIMQNGEVAGIIFSKSAKVDGIAYALTSMYITNGLHKAKNSQVRVGTGACIAN